jgi:hypothetical protein
MPCLSDLVVFLVAIGYYAIMLIVGIVVILVVLKLLLFWYELYMDGPQGLTLIAKEVI